MRRPRLILTVIKEKRGYSAHVKVDNTLIGTQGDSLMALRRNILDAVHLAFPRRSGAFRDEDIQLRPDLRSFFDFYKVVNAKALSARIGMHQSLLAQYVSGIKKVSPAQSRRILHGVRQVGRELANIKFGNPGEALR